MSDDYPVKGRSNQELRRIAAQTHSWFNLRKGERVDIIACLNRGSVMTLLGEMPLTFEVVPNYAMGQDDALTRYEPSAIKIQARETVHNQANLPISALAGPD